MSKFATSRQIVIPEARLSFARLFVPEERVYTPKPGQPPAPPVLMYSAEFIIDQNHPVIQELAVEFLNVARAQWREHGDSVFEMLKAEKRLALHTSPKLDGQTGMPKDEYVGKFRITTSNKYKPAVFDSDNTEIVVDNGRVYDGCYVTGMISLWAQDNPTGGKRINANLLGVRFLRDGDAFGAGSASKVTADAFGPVAVSGNPFAAPPPAAAPAPAAAASFF